MKVFVIIFLFAVTCICETQAQVLPNCGTMQTPVFTSQSITAQSATTASVFFNWTNVGATTYILKYKLSTTPQYPGTAAFTGGVPGCTISGLTLGSTYNILVQASRTCRNGGETDGDVTSVTTTVTLPPPAPNNFSASSVGVTSFVANWSTSAGATSYQLDVSTNSSFSTGLVVNNLTVSGTSATVSGLAQATPYYFRIRAINAAGTSANSSTSTVTTLALPPAAPGMPTTSTVGSTSFVASWSAIAGATGYRLDVSSSDTFSSGNVYTDFLVSTTSQAVSGLVSGTIYYFRVRAVNSGGTSANSPIAVVTLQPDAPGMMPPDSIGSESFVAVWNGVSQVNNYLLDVSTDASFGSFLYNSLPVSSTRQYVYGLMPGTDYHFRVRAAKNGVTSESSTTLSVTTSNVTIGDPDGGALGSLSIQPSPDASALVRYASAPVSLYTGTPQISIPLYEIKEHDLSVSLDLSYHAGGNKIEDIAPRTGLGWTLQGSGVVTRTMRGLPDECGHAPYGTGMLALNFPDDTYLANPYHLKSLASGSADFEPDLFEFNFAGYSGTFMFDWDKKIKVVSSTSIQIEPIGLPTGNDNFIDGWKVIGEDGTIYSFTAIDSTSIMFNGVSRNVPQAWYLTEIKSSNNLSWIHFEYDQYKQMIESLPFETKYYDHFTHLLGDKSGIKKMISRYYGQNLKRITTSSGLTTVDLFKDINPRTDIGGDTTLTGSYTRDNFSLASLKVTNANGRQVKGWSFGYGYGTGRLTLVSLTETAGSLSQPPYLFSYYTGTIPGNTSFSRDHWGFLNSNVNTTTLIPTLNDFVIWKAYSDVGLIDGFTPGYGYLLKPIQLPGADRSPDPTKVLYAMLRQITYPTGGKEIFDFEPHDYSFIQDNEIKEDVLTPQVLTLDLADDQSGESLKEFDFTLQKAGDVNIKSLFYGGYGGAILSIRDKTSKLLTYCAQEKPFDYGSNVYSVNETISFPAGTFTIAIFVKHPGSHEGNHVHSTITYQKISGGATKIVKGGGVRIAKVTRSFGFGNPDQVTKYTYRVTEAGVIKSSGSLVEPIIPYKISLPMGYNNTLRGMIRFSQNSGNTTMGSSVGYSHVTVQYGENAEKGKSIYHYSSPRTVKDIFVQDIPFPPSTNFDHARGLLLDQSDFAFASSTDTLKAISNMYTIHSQDIQALRGGLAVVSPTADNFEEDGTTPLDAVATDYVASRYYTQLGYSRLISQKQRLMQGPGIPPVVTMLTYAYNDSTHKQLVRTSTANSKGEVIVNSFKFPKDYGDDDPAIKMLKEKHMDDVQIESLVWKETTGSQVYLISALKNGFTLDFENINLLNKYAAKISTPQLTSDPYGTAAGLYEARQVYSKYDVYGNLLESSAVDGVKTSFQWNYHSSLPTAKVENASASLRQIFYEGFEDDVTASSITQKTGRKSKAINGTYTIPVANGPLTGIGTTYILSYWVKEGNSEWAYKEKTFQTPGTTISTDPVNGYIDDIRFFPKGAVMLTCTYEPLVGITSSTDSNNVTTFFEYDDLGRVKYVRDMDHNILKSYDYQLQMAVPYKPKE